MFTPRAVESCLNRAYTSALRTHRAPGERRLTGTFALAASLAHPPVLADTRKSAQANGKVGFAEWTSGRWTVKTGAGVLWTDRAVDLWCFAFYFLGHC